MSAFPVASYLVDFGTGRAAPVTERSDAASRKPEPQQGSEPAQASGAKLEEAYATGLEDGKAAGLALMDAKLEEERASFARKLAAERQAWVARESDALAARLMTGWRDLGARIADIAGRVLVPILNEEMRRQAIGDLRAELDILLTQDPGLSISICGPEDLLKSLREHLAGKTCAVTYVSSAESDVRITAGPTVLETRLAAWAAKLAEAVR